MRTTVAVALFLLLCPSISLADRYHDGYRSQPYSYDHRDSNHSRHHSGHGDDWIVPLAIVGGVLGVVALSQMNEPAPPPPPAAFVPGHLQSLRRIRQLSLFPVRRPALLLNSSRRSLAWILMVL